MGESNLDRIQAFCRWIPAHFSEVLRDHFNHPDRDWGACAYQNYLAKTPELILQHWFKLVDEVPGWQAKLLDRRLFAPEGVRPAPREMHHRRRFLRQETDRTGVVFTRIVTTMIAAREQDCTCGKDHLATRQRCRRVHRRTRRTPAQTCPRRSSHALQTASCTGDDRYRGACVEVATQK